MSNGGGADQNVDIAIASRAMQEPLRQIVTNAGEQGSVVLNKMREGRAFRPSCGHLFTVRSKSFRARR